MRTEKRKMRTWRRTSIHRAPAPALVVLAALAACATAPEADRAPAGDPPPAVDRPESTPSIPSPAAEPAQVTLRQVSRRAAEAGLGPEAYAPFGLTGANKPNGPGYRLRRGFPDKTPAYVPRETDGLELFIADAASDGWLALYRTPLARTPDDGANAAYRAVLFDANGAARWSLDLNRFFSRPTRLEVQDVRYIDGKLYFNEACQSYSREAGGQCSSLVRVDPARGAVDWRTPPLTSNDVFILHGPHVVAGYGFTAEADWLRVLDRETGRVVARARLDTAHDYLEIKDGRLHVLTSGSHYVFEIAPAASGRS